MERAAAKLGLRRQAAPKTLLISDMGGFSGLVSCRSFFGVLRIKRWFSNLNKKNPRTALPRADFVFC
jgi:hypothetical protein